MEVNLKREAIQYCTPVYSDTLSREETLETVVSDTLPDVARILDVDAAVYLRSKTLLQGSIRIEGSIRGTVLYIGEDLERLQRIEAELRSAFPRRQRARRIPIYLPRISAYRRRTPSF